MSFTFDAREIENFSNRIKEYFEDFTSSAKAQHGQSHQSGSELYSDALNYYIEVDLPGIRKEDISVAVVAESVVEITGVRSRPDMEGMRSLRSERRYGPFRRSIKLPAEVVIDPDGVTATYRDGVLRVTLPIKGAGVRHTVPVE
jgi:HSP20 family protein